MELEDVLEIVPSYYKNSWGSWVPDMQIYETRVTIIDDKGEKHEVPQDKEVYVNGVLQYEEKGMRVRDFIKKIKARKITVYERRLDTSNDVDEEETYTFDL